MSTHNTPTPGPFAGAMEFVFGAAEALREQVGADAYPAALRRALAIERETGRPFDEICAEVAREAKR